MNSIVSKNIRQYLGVAADGQVLLSREIGLNTHHTLPFSLRRPQKNS